MEGPFSRKNFKQSKMKEVSTVKKNMSLRVSGHRNTLPYPIRMHYNFTLNIHYIQYFTVEIIISLHVATRK